MRGKNPRHARLGIAQVVVVDDDEKEEERLLLVMSRVQPQRHLAVKRLAMRRENS